MRDITDLHKRGVLGVVVATEEFISAAEGQSKALRSSVECVFTKHPIQDRNDEEMKDLAIRPLHRLLTLLRVDFR